MKSALLSVLALCAACSSPPPVPSGATQTPPTSVTEPNIYYTSGDIRVWRDPETGCDYLLYKRGYAGGITPRMNADGTPHCVRASEDGSQGT